MKFIKTLILFFLITNLGCVSPYDGLKKAVDDGDKEKMLMYLGEIDDQYRQREMDEALIRAVNWNRNVNIVATLIDLGANVNFESAGRTPLMHAAKRGDIGSMKLLIDNGANINLQGQSLRLVDGSLNLNGVVITYRIECTNVGYNALYFGINNKREKVVEMLLNLKADPNTEIYITELSDWITFSGFSGTRYRRLIQQGTTVTIFSPPHYWKINNSGGVTSNVMPLKGNIYTTPLIEAIKKKDVAIIKLLIKSGANLDKPDSQRITPLRTAMEIDNKEIVKLLQELGAKE